MPIMDISSHVWDTRYRHRRGEDAQDMGIEDSWRRIAGAVAAGDAADGAAWRDRYLGILRDFRFLPGGRIQAGAGTDAEVTLFNCFVMGPIEDSPDGIARALAEGAATMRQGGGVGYDFSTICPQGTHASTPAADGPVACLRLWDAMCAGIVTTGARRGAMMATLRCDHPDIAAFIAAKRQPGQLLHFNLSVQVTDAFMEAVRTDAGWPLIYPANAPDGIGKTMARISARALWEQLLRASYDRGEPGVLFIDRINRMNNLGYCEQITATNPCGEIPLPPYGACDLGSINLTRLVRDPFSAQATLDEAGLDRIVPIAVRLLDNVIDLSRYPLPAQQQAAHRARRIGLGLTGLADALVMLGIRYGDPASVDAAEGMMRRICHAAYRASIVLARERGAFPAFDRDRYLAAPFIAALPGDIRDGIARHGIRNSHLLAIAPTGTISLLAGNVSSGMEPVFAADYRRNILDAFGQPVAVELVDYAVRLWRERQGDVSLPPAFIATADVPIAAHLDMQAALQRHVDNAISKTINVPAACDFASFAALYDLAYAKGLKGCTAFRANPVYGAVLTAARGMGAPHCCAIEPARR